MATKKLTEQQAAEAFNLLATTPQNAAATFEEAFELLENADQSKLQELAADYWVFEKQGETTSFVFMGFDNITLQGKPVEVVKLVTKDKRNYINGDKVLVSACKKLTILPAYIRVTYVRDEKSTAGSYKVLEVKTFPVN